MVSWYSAIQLLDNVLLRSIINLDPPNLNKNSTDSLIGWPALLQVIRCPPSEKFEVLCRACLDKFDAFTLHSLSSLTTSGEYESLGVSSYEGDFLVALLDLGGLQRFPKTDLCDLLLRVSVLIITMA